MGAANQQGLRSIPNASGGIARLACLKLREAGKDVRALMKSIGLDFDLICDPACRLPTASQISVLELTARELDDDMLGFRLATDYDLREIGLVYYIMASSNDLADALRKCERYSTVVNHGVHLVAGRNSAATISLEYVDVDRRTDRHQIEFWMVSLMRICRRITDTRLAAESVKFRHVRNPVPPEYETFFGAEVEFGAEADLMTLPPFAPALPSIGRDTLLNGLLRRYADEALHRHPAPRPGIRASVERIIPELLPHGGATADEVARRLGTSTRTLSRKLQQEGSPFAAVLDELRADLARRYLLDRDLPISEIAWLLGYREVSSLTHAFRRWTGTTPRQFRASGGETGAPAQPGGANELASEADED